MKKLALFLFISLYLVPHTVSAKYNPLERQNNRYGIHIVDINDIPDASALVNSSGGDWGYITLVIQENDRDIDKWQRVFNQLRRLHLIPIVRIASRIDGSSWTKPDKGDIGNWVSFLNDLNWPVENRYVVVFNEPNQAKEWGNTIEPEEYVSYFVEFTEKIKVKNEDFFILPAGMDASAGNTSYTLDELTYLRKMVTAKPEFLNLIDGWTSHSYPNPAFSAPVADHGRGSLTTFKWELGVLKTLGLTRTLPVFITETGWIHSNGERYEPNLLTPENVSDNLTKTADTIWKAAEIVAITPFILNYQGGPFDHFSWKKLGSGEFYPHYYAYQSIGKPKGNPRQREKYFFTSPLVPDILISGSRYTLTGSLKNIGQGILSSQDNYEISVTTLNMSFETFEEPLPILEPGQEGVVMIHMQTPRSPGTSVISVKLLHGTDTLLLEEKNVTLVPPPSLTVTTKLGWSKPSNASDATVLVYDAADNLLHKYPGIVLKDGIAHVDGLTNIIPGQKYRVVVLVPYYLPRQELTKLTATDTSITVKRLLPFDLDADGRFSLGDIRTLFQSSPQILFKRVFGSL